MALSSPPDSAIAVHRPETLGPVVVSVPHAGRIYPPEILRAARVDRSALERLEDRWCDRIAARTVASGATLVEALWARAVADCNRGEGQMAPGEVAPALRPQFSAPGRKERAGLGVVPTRLAQSGVLWGRPIDRASFEWRLDSVHRPYHRALTDTLDAARQRFGHAVLIDLHSMPTIPALQPGHGAQIVVGDRFGASCGDWLAELVVGWAERLGVEVTRNLPYAGGHIVRTHGEPARGIHAVQIEIDRSLYLDGDNALDAARLERLADWFGALVVAASGVAPGAENWPLAAE
jgi:N-formylglutamate amidohydrolase